MPITFDHPALLSLLLLTGPVVWLGLRQLTVLDPARRSTALVLRFALISLLVAMLAGLRTQRTHDDLTVIAVVDRSASVRTFGHFPPAPHTNNGSTPTDAAVLSFLETAADDRRPDDRLGLVTYDGRPSLRVRPAPRNTLDAATLDDPRQGTDTAAALNHALASLTNADTALRLVLVSDGNDTAGDLLAAARAAAAAGVEIDILPVPYRVGAEVMVQGVYAPAQAREGQTVAVRVVLRGTAPVPGTVELLRDGVVLDLDPAPDRTGIDIQPAQWVARDAPHADAKEQSDEASGIPGTPEPNNKTPTGTSGVTSGGGDGGGDTSGGGDFVLAVTLDIPMTTAGPTSFTAVFEPDRANTAAAAPDLAINNKAQGFTQVAGKGKILFVDHLGGAPGKILPDTLRARGLELERIAPDAFPTTLPQLQRYDAVVFQNVPADDIRPSQQDLLVQYVKELGGGFVMVGGPDSFGAGGWTQTALDRHLLPVDCEIPSQTILPSGALVIVLDRSGSMSSPVGTSGISQMQLAIDAASLAVRTLYPQDMVGVVAFDHSAKWVVPLQPNTNPTHVEKLIRSIEPDGGTDIYAGLLAAYNALADPNARVQDNAVRHVILLTDGQSDGAFEQLANQMRRAGITMSTIGVGDGHEAQRLQQLAYLGGGQYHGIADPNNLPQVFIKEARTIRKNLIKEESFLPQPVNTGSPITAGLTFNQPLQGLVLTGQRLDRRVDMPLLGPEGEPLFAHGQVGLGRAAAFTSDATNRWAAPWLNWPGYADFWTRTLRTIARPTASRDADLITTFENNQLQLTLNTYTDTANPTHPTTPHADAEEQSDEASGTRASNPNPTTTVRGGVLKPDGTIAQITLHQTGPGRYQAALPATDDGNYIASLYLTDHTGQRSAVFGGASRAPGEELRRFNTNHPTLKQVAQLTGGRILSPANPDAAKLFDRTEPFTTVSSRPLRWTLMPWLLALLLLDIANRRIAWDAPAIAAWTKAHLAPTRADANQRQTLAALKHRKSKSTPPLQPTHPTTPHTHHADDHADAKEQSDEASGPRASTSTTTIRPNADAKPASKPASQPQTPAPPRDASTTARLLAAKRRANQDPQ